MDKNMFELNYGLIPEECNSVVLCSDNYFGYVRHQTPKYDNYEWNDLTFIPIVSHEIINREDCRNPKIITETSGKRI